MASKEEGDKYAAELTQRFEELTKWAIANWPNKQLPLQESDFDQGRREIAQIIGPKLSEGESNEPVPRTHIGDTVQYRDVTPMPWP